MQQQLAEPTCDLRGFASLHCGAVVQTNHDLTVPAWGELLAEPPDAALMLQKTSRAVGNEQLKRKFLDDITSARDEASTALLHSQGSSFAGRARAEFSSASTLPSSRRSMQAAARGDTFATLSVPRSASHAQTQSTPTLSPQDGGPCAACTLYSV